MITILSGDITAPSIGVMIDRAKSMNVDVNVIDVCNASTKDLEGISANIITRIGPKSVACYERACDVLGAQTPQQMRRAIIAFDKARSYEVLSAANLPVPVTEINHLHHFSNDQKFPYVLKVARGNKGRGVYLVETSDDLKSIRQSHNDKEIFLKQQYIKESKGNDKRLFVVGDTVVASMRRVAQGNSFLSNLSQGAAGENYTPSDIEQHLAVAATKAHGLEYAGVDIIDSANGPLILEVNPSPGFIISKVTGVDVAALIVKNCMKRNELHEAS